MYVTKPRHAGQVMICPNCGREFDPADRASCTANAGSIAQIRYCSRRCKRQAGNRRYYTKHAGDVKRRVRKNQRKGES